MNCFSPLLASFFISIKPEETAIVLNQKLCKSYEQKATFNDHKYLWASTKVSFLPAGLTSFDFLSFLSFSFLSLYSSTSHLFFESGVKGRTISASGGRMLRRWVAPEARALSLYYISIGRQDLISLYCVLFRIDICIKLTIAILQIASVSNDNANNSPGMILRRRQIQLLQSAASNAYSS